MTLALSLKISGKWKSSKLAMPMATLRALTSNSTGAPVEGGVLAASSSDNT